MKFFHTQKALTDEITYQLGLLWGDFTKITLKIWYKESVNNQSYVPE